MEKRVFEHRLNRFAVSEEMKEKYLQVFDQMVAAQNISDAEVQNRIRRIKFAGYVTATGRLLYCQKEIDRCKAQFRLIDVDDTKNLLSGMNALVTRPADHLQRIGKFRVYVQGDIFTPQLYLRDILAQIPAERLNGVTAISLKLDDMFPAYGYNILADAYEYRIGLFE